MPRISVVMTAYNHSQYIPAAIDSILAQDCGAVELIVVDDGSKEDIAAVVAPYGDKVLYIRQDNAGLGSARNTGLWASTGEFVAFCDSDDIHLPFRLSAHAQLLDAHPDAAQVFSDLAMYEDEKVTSQTTLRGRFDYDFDAEIAGAFPAPKSVGEYGIALPAPYSEASVFHGRITDLIAAYHVAWGGASLYRRAALVSVGGHDATLRRWADWGLASRLSKNFEMIYLDAPVLWYRQHGGQLTKQPAIGAACYRDIVYREWKADPVFAARRPDLLASMVARASIRHAHYLMEESHYREARKHLYDYIRVRPTDRHGYTAALRSLVMEKLLRRDVPAP